jgi:hypothetical protein
MVQLNKIFKDIEDIKSKLDLIDVQVDAIDKKLETGFEKTIDNLEKTKGLVFSITSRQAGQIKKLDEIINILEKLQ